MPDKPGSCSRCGGSFGRDLCGGICPACLLEEGLPASEGYDPQLTDHDFHQSSPFVHQFGDYDLMEEIGRGGMGVIYKARHRQLDRIVALKMLLAGEFADAKSRARLLREAKIAANLSHPHFVTIHDAGECQGRAFFAMEYVPGPNLAQFTHQQPLSTEEAVSLVEQLAHAIHFAHKQGVIHRDLKPANVLIGPGQSAKLTDFGLTRSPLFGAQSHTLESAGTPNFMAPEQADGRLGKTGPHTDIFGLGAILYFLLTGRPPIEGGTLAEVLSNAVNGEMIRPRSHRPEMPVELESICLRCLQKDPQQRYASAQELAEDLRRYASGEFNKRPSAHSQFRGTAGWALAGVALVLLILGGIALKKNWKGTRDPVLQTAKVPPRTEDLISPPLLLLDAFDSEELHPGWNRPDQLFDACTTALHLQGGRAYLLNASKLQALAKRSWGGKAPYDRNWTVQIDVHVGRWRKPVRTNDTRIWLGLEIFNAEDPGDSVIHEFALQPNDAGWPDRFIGAQFSNNSTFRGLDGIRSYPAGRGPELVTLQVRFDAARKEITLAYAENGSAHGGAFEDNTHLAIATAANDWKMTATSQFGLRLTGGSRGVELPADLAFFDNLLSTSFATSK